MKTWTHCWYQIVTSFTNFQECGHVARSKIVCRGDRDEAIKKLLNQKVVAHFKKGRSAIFDYYFSVYAVVVE